MNAIDWSKNTFHNEKAQHILEEKIKILMLGPLKDRDEYAKEKAVKAFCEGLGYLESLLEYQHGIHRNQIDLVRISQNPSEYTKSAQEIEKTLLREIERQYRHFITFL